MRRTAFPRQIPLWDRVRDVLGGWTSFYYCPNPHCNVRISVRGTSPGEVRRYQEVVANHGRHCTAA